MKLLKRSLFNRNKQKYNSVQEWLPVKDIENGLLYRKDNNIVAVLKLAAINIDLLSQVEKERVINTLQKILNGVNYDMQWLSLGKAVDLDTYIYRLEQQATNTNSFVRKKLLRSYIKQAAEMALGGEAITREFYILLNCENTPGLDLRLRNIAKDLCSSLVSLGLNAELCTDQEIIELLFVFNNPVNAGFEQSPIYGDYYLPPNIKDN